jgi:hypothetical protein
MFFMGQNELLPMVQSKNLTLSFSSESSIEEELKRESTADVITILVSFFLVEEKKDISILKLWKMHCLGQ